MKKALAFFLSLLIMTSLVACGSNNTDTGEPQTSQTETETRQETIASEEPQIPTETEPELPVEPEQPDATESIASVGFQWTGVGYVMPIPEPPFAYTTKKANSTYVSIVSAEGANDAITHAIILTYCDELKAAGFTVDAVGNVIGERYGRTCYDFTAKDSQGNCVYLLDDGGSVVIELTMTSRD